MSRHLMISITPGLLFLPNRALRKRFQERRLASHDLNCLNAPTGNPRVARASRTRFSSAGRRCVRIPDDVFWKIGSICYLFLSSAGRSNGLMDVNADCPRALFHEKPAQPWQRGSCPRAATDMKVANTFKRCGHRSVKLMTHKGRSGA
jgi:hypothetical protein